jgi:hypothetical protein
MRYNQRLSSPLPWGEVGAKRRVRGLCVSIKRLPPSLQPSPHGRGADACRSRRNSTAVGLRRMSRTFRDLVLYMRSLRQALSWFPLPFSPHRWFFATSSTWLASSFRADAGTDLWAAQCIKRRRWPATKSRALIPSVRARSLPRGGNAVSKSFRHCQATFFKPHPRQPRNACRPSTSARGGPRRAPFSARAF